MDIGKKRVEEFWDCASCGEDIRPQSLLRKYPGSHGLFLLIREVK